MPLVRLPTTGAELVASANVYLRRTVTIVPGTSTNFLQDINLQINNLPNIFVWIRQTGGVMGLSFFPSFAVDNIDVAGVVTPNWLPLTVPQAVFLNQPSFFTFRIVATMLTLGVDYPGGGIANATVEVVIGASQ